MSINAEDATAEIEEERRLCYVGITRAQEHLTLSYAKQRMLRGETRFNMMSRFLREVPAHLTDAEEKITKRPAGATVDKSYPDKFILSGSVGESTAPIGNEARNAFYRKPYETKQFTVTKATALDYEVGDTVSHVKFGVGMVTDIVEGGRDYEVTVNFDTAGVKKLFASFAKLKKL